MKLGWGKGAFSKELTQDFRKEHLTEAIGKTLECEDGRSRRVVEICFSSRWPWKLVINEQDPDSKAGHFINVLSFSAQMLGKPIPDYEAQQAFERAMKMRFGIENNGSFHAAPKSTDTITLSPPRQES